MSIGTPEDPVADRPIRREKNRSICCGAPNWKIDAFSRKNGRFSGKNRSKRVQVHLLLVGLHLREIGVDREVGGEVRPHAPLHVEPDVAVAVARGHRWRAVKSLFDRASTYGVSLRSRRGGRLSPFSFAADDTRNTSKPRCTGERNTCSFLRRMLRLTLKPQVVSMPVGVTQRLERNRHLGFPAALGDRGPHAPVAVPIQVQRADRAALRSAGAGLDSARCRSSALRPTPGRRTRSRSGWCRRRTRSGCR